MKLLLDSFCRLTAFYLEWWKRSYIRHPRWRGLLNKIGPPPKFIGWLIKKSQILSKMPLWYCREVAFTGFAEFMEQLTDDQLDHVLEQAAKLEALPDWFPAELNLKPQELVEILETEKFLRDHRRKQEEKYGN